MLGQLPVELSYPTVHMIYLDNKALKYKIYLNTTQYYF